MKLLFDENLSPTLVHQLGVFPGSVHAHTVGLDSAADEQIWEFARLNDFAIVTKDEDFNALSVIRGDFLRK